MRVPRRVPPVLRVALTGGVACGKSTVARLFEALGAKHLDTDQIAREIVQPPSAVLDRVTERFGADILTPEGVLDRARLRQIVFADSTARKDLEAIMHPAIRARVAEQSAAAGGPYQLISIPLLVETGTEREYHRVLVVDCEPAIQLQRLMLRDGLRIEDARRLIDAQATSVARLAIASDVIRNDGDIATLAPQVEALHGRYRQLARELSAPADSPD